MDISIIIPCYNLEFYIKKCLNSILSQNYDKRNFEIIVILDSCTDNSENIVRDVLKGRAQDKIIRAAFRRPGLSRNLGLELATGKYVWFIDGDDFLIDKQALGKLILTMQTKNATVGYIKKFVSEKPVAENWAAWRYFYVRQFIGNTRFSDKYIDEDIEFFRVLSRKRTFKITYIDGLLYHHTFPRKGSIVTEHNINLFEDYL